MAANHLPSAILASPDTRISIRASHDLSSNFHCESRAQCRHCHIVTDASNLELLRMMLAKPYRSRTVCREIFRLGTKLAAGPGKKKIFADEVVQRSNIRVELRLPDPLFELDDIVVSHFSLQKTYGRPTFGASSPLRSSCRPLATSSARPCGG